MATASLNVSRAFQSDPLCSTFTQMADKIWTDLKKARALGLRRGEETVTEDLLLYVASAHPKEVTTFPFNKHQEGKTGADWEWWLTDGNKWFGMLVQAKILDCKSNLYSSINHKVQGRLQIDILTDQAHLKGIDALYFFYNYTRQSFPPLNWKCRSTAPEIEQLGCTVANAFAVKRLIGRRGVGIKLNPITLPLRCLVCCRGFLHARDDSLPSRAASIARELQRLGIRDEDLTDGVSGLRKDPPSYVRQLLAAAPDERSAVIDSLRSDVGPIGSLIVIKEARG